MYVCMYVCIYTYIYKYIYIYIYGRCPIPPYFWNIYVFSWFLTNPEAQSHVIYDIV